MNATAFVFPGQGSQAIGMLNGFAGNPVVADTIAACRAQGKDVSVCGEMAGDVALTRLLLGLGLRSFSMHPAQILAVKQVILRADTTKLQPWAQKVCQAEEPALEIEAK